ncbi:MAG: addiction module protein [Micrococcales bacterium]|nr:addiction module protein [Micrococcales bacterium]
MTSRLADYIRAGRALDVGERLEAAHQLLLSVEQDTDTDQADIDAAWSKVVNRRVAEILDHTADLVDGRAAHARVRAEIAALRKCSAAGSQL